ncbi:MAG TPA: signal peptide peptidase SppA, partial [Acidimicrobiales bacterium]|nr:signal peptide peptidase SppA [Acidimicrobiales bacterium]
MKNVRRVLLGLLATGTVALAVVGLTALISLFVHHLLDSAEVAGAVVVASLLATAIVTRLAMRVPSGAILELDLPSAPAEVASRNPLAGLAGRRALTLGETVAALDRASGDKRVGGLILRPRFETVPRAVIEELRDAVIAFGETGKPTVAVTDSFGEGGPANSAYYLATACHEVVLHPTGMLGMAPLSREPNFYRGLLDRLGIDLEVSARQEFKSAANQLSERGFTGPDRQQSQRLLDSLWEREVDGVARARKLAPERVRRLADSAPLLASEALDAGLVDRLAYTDEVVSAAKASVGPKSKLLYLSAYKKRAGKGRQAGKAVPVAVLRAVGEIHRSTTVPFGLRGGPILAADRFIPQIRAAAKDKKVKAFVLRVDSPGGSAVASDAIWRELVKLRELGKPLVVSMGAVAASGGYYVATAADRVVAQPGTITGSIGVITVHPVLAKAKAKLAVTADEVHTGTEPSMFSVNRPHSETQRQRTEAELDNIYDVFTGRVAEGRKLPIESVLDAAKGRVWTGADAANIGLVDELGGLQRAMALAVELSGVPAGTRARPKPFPQRQARLGRLLSKQPQSSDDVAATAAVAAGGGALL